MGGRPTISLCMIAKDEEQFLSSCIQSVRAIVDEIIVVDTGSSDKTIEIARSHGATVISKPWGRDFSEARNESLAHATGDWILVLDADETISAPDAELLRTLVTDDEADAYPLIQRNYFKGRAPTVFEVPCAGDSYPESKPYAGYFPSELVRLFRNRRGYRFSGMIHELVEPSIKQRKGVIKKSGVPIHHFRVDKDKEFDLKKRETYLEMGEEQIRKTPDDPKPYYEVGVIYADKKQYPTAVERFERAVQLIEASPDPQEHRSTYAYVCFNLGVAYTRVGKYDLAVKSLEKTQHSGRLFIGVHFFLGTAYAGMGRLTDAIAAYRQAHRLNPGDEEVLNNLANLYSRTGQGEAAVKTFLSALEIAPRNATIYRNLGATYLGMGKFASAHAAFAKSVELNPAFGPELAGLLSELAERAERTQDIDYSFSLGN